MLMRQKEWIDINTRFMKKHRDAVIDAGCEYVDWFTECGPHYTKSPRYNWAKRWINRYLRDGMTVLDVGGGLGAFGTYFTAVMGHRFNYVNLEILDFVELTPDYFEAFGLPWEGHRYIQLDALKEKFPFDAETFDMTWMFGWYGMRSGFDKLFPEIFSLLKPSGMLFFNVPDEAAKPPGSKKTISRDTLETMLTNAGYEIVFLNMVSGDYDYRVMCRKPK